MFHQSKAYPQLHMRGESCVIVPVELRNVPVRF